MPNTFPSKEELMLLPINKLRTIDVKDRFEEELLQAVINLKTAQQPPQTPVKTNDIPDIYNAADEAKWQKIMDDRRAGLKPQVEVTHNEAGIDINITSTATTKEVKLDEVAPVTIQVEPKIETGLVKCDVCGKEMKARGLNLHRGKFHKK